MVPCEKKKKKREEDNVQDCARLAASAFDFIYLGKKKKKEKKDSLSRVNRINYSLTVSETSRARRGEKGKGRGGELRVSLEGEGGPGAADVKAHACFVEKKREEGRIEKAAHESARRTRCPLLPGEKRKKEEGSSGRVGGLPSLL